MNTTVQAPGTERTKPPVARGIGLTGRVPVTWAMGGGLLVGGFLVAGMTLAGRLSGGGLLQASTGLFVVGAILGYVHGAALGYLGRPAGTTRGEAAAALGLAALYALPALAVAWAATGWIAMTTVALYLGRPGPLVGVGVAWLAGLVFTGLAARTGWRALRNAYARWEDRRAGTVLAAATLGALLVIFLAERPELWGTQIRVTEVGAVLLAVGATLWIGLPVIAGGLRLLRAHGYGPRVEVGVPNRRTLVRLALGATAGIGVGLLALPFHAPPLAVPAPGAAAGDAVLGTLIAAASAALVDEVLLRLFVVSGLAWLLLRWRGRTEGTAVLAVVGAAFAQVLLYVPGILEIGFPNTLAALGYVAAAVMVPALVFGALFWTSGLATALVAHAAALLALAFFLG